ncbi:hypothetical protein AV530_016527 [Patagioenas fasciata monilis]|uniref:Uncharacterized protein n=1 Tax=Patagioenas fasciata monilis TaxID=372326 RepID=A0A1V4J2W1_PATFA|nr:hypothetical protein AV530_016527 [Patagioenas fasciata monilis]
MWLGGKSWEIKAADATRGEKANRHPPNGGRDQWSKIPLYEHIQETGRADDALLELQMLRAHKTSGRREASTDLCFHAPAHPAKVLPLDCFKLVLQKPNAESNLDGTKSTDHISSIHTQEESEQLSLPKTDGK